MILILILIIIRNRCVTHDLERRLFTAATPYQTYAAQTLDQAAVRKRSVRWRAPGAGKTHQNGTGRTRKS